VRELQQSLPSLRATLLIRSLWPEEDVERARDTELFDEVVETPASLAFLRVGFDHPLCILYSSGTTGVPKGIVHGYGGILLEHLKSLGLGMDIRAGDRYFFYSSTSWMA